MINTSHPGIAPDDTETASDLYSATGQPGIIGDWAARLAKLLRIAIRAVDTDRECAKAAIARASSLLRVQVERSSFDLTHNRVGLEPDKDVRRQVEEALRADHASAEVSASRVLLYLIAIDITSRRQAEEALGDLGEPLQITATLAITGDGDGLHSLLLKAVINGRGEEAVNFAKNYLWR